MYEEALDQIRANGSVLWPRNLFELVRAWARHFRVEMQLGTYETWLRLRALAGLEQVGVKDSFRA